MYKVALSEDILHRFEKLDQVNNDLCLNEAMIHIEDKIIRISGKKFSDFGMPTSPRREELLTDFIKELSYNIALLDTQVSETEPRLLPEKKDIYNKILQRVELGEGSLFFLDAPGSTGKTFLLNLLLAKIRKDRNVALAVASSGIAATLLSGGRTPQSVFKLPLNLASEENPTFNIRTAIRGFSSDRPRGTTFPDDRYIVLQARRNRRQTAGKIARHTTQATGRPISRFTVARRLHGGGLFARRPVLCVPLTPSHRRRRFLWCREHRNGRDNEWGRVLFTDESRFSLSSDFHRILIWRKRGRRNHTSNIIERDRYGGRGVLVWGGIMLGSRTDLHIFSGGSVNGTRYCNEILFPYVRLFRGAMGLQFLFMDDNAPCHRTVAAEQLLESEDIERMDWPARSPDLNPIEHA
ncbi:transposable element Tc1 transposase [Trichonephila clavipes]|nr:transposable element Tc1 transposase [Trichonephila clavipes]